MAGTDLSLYPVHLGRGATALGEPEFTGDMQWYVDYGARHAADGVEGRLVSMFTFREPWSTWEKHPNGSEVVLCVRGTLVLHQEQADGAIVRTTLEPGQYAINPPGVWHTADVSGEATALFITAGLGTEVRPR
ncbi:MAG TPA: cupin domain-containing protein [Rhizomicrobium sp.]|nr:cupin domain-containing protein [Rhizomicrobium sp.]